MRWKRPSPVILSKQGCNAAMLVLQRPPVDLGWVGCEHHLCVLHSRSTPQSFCKYSWKAGLMSRLCLAEPCARLGRVCSEEAHAVRDQSHCKI